MNNRKNHIKNQFAKILKKYRYNLNPGDIVAGTILHKENSGFLVNIGDKISGYLPTDEIPLMSRNNKYNSKTLLIKNTRDFFLVKYSKNNRQYIVSIKRLDYMRGWERIKQSYQEDIIFHVPITYFNKGGIITYLEGIQGFIPKSHIYIDTGQKIKQKKNQKDIIIPSKILGINEKRNQLILSNKSAIFYLSKHKFKLGEILYGQIIVIKSYGLFLNIYGIKALLHISEIGFNYIKNINLFFKVGKLIKVKIIHINNIQGQLSVSKRNVK
uniref:Ribosomal protein S1 n=1 Tax=Kuetzingia canaliculata TaxID=228262 RepID=A0A1Z1MPJ0_KUECA|nr:ribosomal protein S1 [Kuetzingia canaliculata]ARW67968.1 ribosomal protein S1 [Kuetzingia canaliculata]